MEIWLWAFIGITGLIILFLLVKIHMLQKTAKEIAIAFADKLLTETNTLIDISSGNKSMRSLANQINTALRKLRFERHRFQQGDLELKCAITNISHDLRTPLTAICGYLDLLEQEDKSETVSRYIEVIRDRTEMLRQLTDELFRYSMVLAAKQNEILEPVVINRVLEESIAAFYAALNEKGMTPNISMPDKEIVRTLSRSSLSRVFSNLLNNAMKYSDGDLDIVLSEDGEITFTNTASKLNAVQAGRLFDRFYTVETARTSTGLGLSIAKTLILQMNGTINATYEDQRLCIIIRFPES